MAKQGVREVNLLGQNVNAYQGLLEDDETADLALLINIVAKLMALIAFATPPLIRFEFSDALIQAYAEVPS